MRTIIAGSRTLEVSIERLHNIILESKIPITEIISGGAQGIDSDAIDFASIAKINYRVMYANWNKFGIRAGPVRNEEMAEVADALIAIWDGESKGTNHMIGIARMKHLKVYIYQISKP